MQPARTVLLLRASVLAAAVTLAASCARDCQPPAEEAASAALANPGGAPVPLFICRGGGNERLRTARDTWRDRTFDEYLQSLRRECGPRGKFLVDGDVAISDVKLLRGFFEDSMQGAPAPPESMARPAVIWTTQRKHALTYCVSTAFGAQHDKVVADMEAATGAWEQAASVDFGHVAAQDTVCNAQNDAVTFDVNPVDVGGAYLARAFFPGEPRDDRNVYIDLGALALDPAQALQLTGVLRHELGHVLGFGHDRARTDSSACPEDADHLSVMRDPDCNGGTGWKLLLTDRDKSSAACAYGSAPGFSIDPAICTARIPPMPPASAPIAKSFANQVVARAAGKEYGPFDAKPGSLVRVSMRPRGPRPGDPDVYVRLGKKPVAQPPAFDCRPFLSGAIETCELDAGASPNNSVHILVRGYTAGSYDLEVSFVPLIP